MLVTLGTTKTDCLVLASEAKEARRSSSLCALPPVGLGLPCPVEEEAIRIMGIIRIS